MPDTRLPEGRQTRPTVLIVEDHADSAEMYALGLGADGFHTVTVSSAAEVFITACETPPDVVVADVILGGATGLDLTRALRQDARTRDTVILVLSGHCGETAERDAVAAGSDVFLAKPCLPDRLSAEIRLLLEMRRANRRPPYEAAFQRIRAEYVEMPGMRLTAEQVQRLSGVDLTTCQAVLADLVRAGFLRAAPDGTYVRTAGAMSR